MITSYFFASDCFEIHRDVGHRNMIINENVSVNQTARSPLECLKACELEKDCKFYMLNLRNTNLRGCWLLRNDPHFGDTGLKTEIIGPSHCSKHFSSFKFLIMVKIFLISSMN